MFETQSQRSVGDVSFGLRLVSLLNSWLVMLVKLPSERLAEFDLILKCSEEGRYVASRYRGVRRESTGPQSRKDAPGFTQAPAFSWHSRKLQPRRYCAGTASLYVFQLLFSLHILYIAMAEATTPVDPKAEAAAAERAAWRAEQIRQLRIDSRFSLPFGMRLPLATSISFLSGMALGASHGSQAAGFRFRAENAHRLPHTSTGWYLYHKSKNYHMALGAVKEGLKMGAKISIWVAGLFSIEDMFDRYRGTKDFLNTVVASLSVAGGFSLWSIHLSSLSKLAGR